MEAPRARPRPAAGRGCCHAALLLGADAMVSQIRGLVESALFSVESVLHLTLFPADVRLAGVAHAVPGRHHERTPGRHAVANLATHGIGHVAVVEHVVFVGIDCRSNGGPCRRTGGRDGVTSAEPDALPRQPLQIWRPPVRRRSRGLVLLLIGHDEKDVRLFHSQFNRRFPMTSELPRGLPGFRNRPVSSTISSI